VPRITELLYWDDNNRNHLWLSHRVRPDEVEEVLFGVDGDEAVYRQLRDGDYLKIYGETSSGRLLKLVGEFMKDGRFRVFAAQDMDDREKRAFRGR
jgi:hypothetical protein